MKSGAPWIRRVTDPADIPQGSDVFHVVTAAFQAKGNLDQQAGDNQRKKRQTQPKKNVSCPRHAEERKNLRFDLQF